jgi:hypothetical protein
MITVPRFGFAFAKYIAESRGYELVRRHFYSPLPDLPELRTDSAIALIEEQLAPYIQEFDPPSAPVVQ